MGYVLNIIYKVFDCYSIYFRNAMIVFLIAFHNLLFFFEYIIYILLFFTNAILMYMNISILHNNDACLKTVIFYIEVNIR